MLRFIATWIGILFVTVALNFQHTTMAQSTPPTVPTDWQTFAEKTDYRETPRYDEAIAYARKLADASPLIRFESFGASGESRALPLLIAASDNSFTPQAARNAG